MSARAIVRIGAAAAVVLAAITFSAGTGEAHKAITSRYQFNEDVFPVVRDRCGRCHVDGGVAPMSLMTFDDAAPWAESLRIELLSDTTPAWHPLKLNARELDLLLVWATGGAPRGKPEHAPAVVPLVNAWGSGAPDVTLQVAKPFVLAGATVEATSEVVLPIPARGARAITAIDVLPGNPAMVRSATLLLKTPDGAARELASWLPGQPAAVALTSPVPVTEGAAIVARFVYKRTWKYEGQDLSDRSTVGLYYAAPAKKTAGRAAVPRP
ncbi:MAG: hypothetical protein ABI880_02205 [Acidobacteriota bacterium]